MSENDNQSLYKTIVETIRSTLDSKEVKLKIVETIGKSMSADICSIIDYDKVNDSFSWSEYQYLSSNLIEPFNGTLSKSMFPGMSVELRKGKTVFVKNGEVFVDNQKCDYEIDVQTLLENGIECGYTVPLKYRGELFGLLIIQYAKTREDLSSSESLIQDIATQIAMAIWQAKLYDIAKSIAKREALLRNISDKIRRSLDIEETLDFICEEIAELFEVQRVTVVNFYDQSNFENYLIRREYKVNPELKGLSSSEYSPKAAAYWNYTILNNGFLAIDDIPNSDAPDYFKECYAAIDIKSMLGVSIKKGDFQWGTLVLSEYNFCRSWTDEEKYLLNIIADQIFIAINQSELYEQQKANAKRETLLRRITEKLRSSLDIDEILSFICEELNSLFDVQRTIIAYYPQPELPYLYGKIKECKAYPEVRTVEDKEKYIQVAKYWTDFTVSTGQLLAIDDLANADVADYFKENYLNIGIKSAIALPIKNDTSVSGNLVLFEYEKLRHWTDEDKYLLEAIANQIYLAVNQAELYEKQIANANREALLRKITENIRCSLDIDETLFFICKETANLFKAQRATVSLFENNDYYTPVKMKEYKEFDTISGMDDIKDRLSIVKFLGESLFKPPYIISYDDIQNSGIPDEYKSKYLNIGVKSLIGVGIQKDNEILGFIVLTEYENGKQWSEDEKTLLIDIASQVHIAIIQAKLYEKQKLMVERERISRSIIEILRSSIDRTIIKKLFVKNIGKFLGADRVLLSEYNEKSQMYLPVDENSEYLSRSEEVSFIGYDWAQSQATEYIQPLLEKRELNIYSLDEYLNSNNKSQGFIDLFVNANVKSSYNFPIIYQQLRLGFFCIEFTQHEVRMSDEDIIRIRSMCTQAGIALYHAHLYEDAQECMLSKESFIAQISEKIKTPTHEILDASLILSENDFERSVESEYLNKIINSCNSLLYLTETIKPD